jgi:DNA-binding NtrC family response regulator
MAKTILLADDDPHILETAKDILEAAGYNVLTAETGAGTLQCLEDHPCDLLIVDFNLLDMTGIELAVKAKRLRPALFVILMTGESSVDLGEAKTIIQAILTKPVHPPDLFALIHKILP